MNTKLTLITPKMATEMLKGNTGNRKIRIPHVNRLKSEIISGRWIVTHQGIAFDDTGALLDGQHRLMAIEASGKSVQMLVTHGIPRQQNGTNSLRSMDVIDCGHRRTTADQLHLLHGVKNTNHVVGTLRAIAYVFTSQNKASNTLTVGQAMAMLEIFRDGLEPLLVESIGSKICQRTPIIAALTIGHHVAPEIALTFMQQLRTGNGIGDGDPVYALRESLISYPPRSTEAERTNLLFKTSNCLYNTIQGTSIRLAKVTKIGMEWFMQQDKKTVETVRKIVFGE